MIHVDAGKYTETYDEVVCDAAYQVTEMWMDSVCIRMFMISAKFNEYRDAVRLLGGMHIAIRG